MSHITIDGEIHEIRYQSSDTLFTVCEVVFEGTLITAVGKMPFVCAGETVRLTGSWTTHPDYGEQFSVVSVQHTLPETSEAIYTYLASGIISGIRSATARKIVDTFGDETFDIIRTNPLALTKVKGISPKRAQKISESFLLRQEASQTVMFFQQFGISPTLSLKIHNRYGQLAIDIVRENPFILCDDIEGIGFKTADKIAVSMGISPTHPARICGGIKYALSSAVQNGHTCYPREPLIPYCASLLGCELFDIENAITQMLLEGHLIVSEDMCYLPLFYNMEIAAAERLVRLAMSHPIEIPNADALIKCTCRDCSVELSSEQERAVRAGIENGVLVITGGPGTGKTTIINVLLKIMTNASLHVSLAAPTGKAAKRMSETCGCEAKTLHRLLEVDMNDGTGTVFARNEENPLDADAVIVDEMSMVDITILASLLRAMRSGSRLIMVGDVDQLPSVGAGNVLRDIIGSEVFPIVRLCEVFRQARESLIVTNAHRINNGEMPILSERAKDFFFLSRCAADTAATVTELASVRLPRTYDYSTLWDLQVLCPSRKGAYGVESLNARLQEVLNPPAEDKEEKGGELSRFREGDKVIQIKNNYDILWTKKDGSDEGHGIYNGDIGVIAAISNRDHLMRVEFEDERIVEYDFAETDNLELAYALTVHKSQGCEFRAVIIPVSPTAPMLMVRNLLYTAITRAREMVVLVGSEDTIRRMVDNNRITDRYSMLKRRFEDAAAKIQG
ncbi:MAG: ATP-dependent RecD-like DNA helicase [Clostridia bacterium]|nr:ATP-dependent RecD-like DNA helicase [Clostridia bacterium]